jgi:hypothetical protein
VSPEAQRIAIAEACGKDADYLHDLNAMHEAETFIPNGKEQVYFETLHDVSGNLTFYRSTAAQRAEAFLKTLNLWKS